MSSLKTRLERLEEAAVMRPDEGLKDVPFETVLWVAFGCGEVNTGDLPKHENLVRGLFNSPEAQAEYLPLALRLLRIGLSEERARFIVRASQGVVTEAEVWGVEREIGLTN